MNYCWYLSAKGLFLGEVADYAEPDFSSEKEGEEWIRKQLCACLLGNPLDTELEIEVEKRFGRMGNRREWLEKQAKRELLNES